MQLYMKLKHLIIGFGALMLLRSSNKRKKIVSLANSQLAYFSGKLETDKSIHDRLLAYWREGANWTWINENNIHTIDNEQPWSSAGLCYVMSRFVADWPKTASHSNYVIKGRSNRANNIKGIKSYKPHEYAPKVGDVVVQSRGSWYGTLDTLYSGATTHGDIVIQNTGDKIVCIGFNLSNTVKKVEYEATNGFINTSRHFAVVSINEA